MSERGHITLDDFARDIVRPLVLSGIKSGSYDSVLGEMLAEHAAGTFTFDEEIVSAMLRRALIVASSRKWPWWDESVPSGAKIGAQLRIRLPS